MKVLISGSRGITDYEFVRKCLDDALRIEIVVGDAKGVDTLVQEYCMKRGIKCEIYHADWDKYGRAAGPIRNSEMVSKCDIGMAIWDGVSYGTKDAIYKLNHSHKLLKVMRK